MHDSAAPVPPDADPRRIAAWALWAFLTGEQDRAVSLFRVAVVAGAEPETFTRLEQALRLSTDGARLWPHLSAAAQGPTAGLPAAASGDALRREGVQAHLRKLDEVWAGLYTDARSGDADACCGLAHLLNVCGDPAGAEHWYRVAIDAGDPQGAAANDLGDLYEGRGLLDDAARMWREAADRGSARGMTNLGNMAAERQDWPRAEQWYRAAVAAGDPDGSAAGNLGNVAQLTHREAEAERWWTEAAEKDHAPALVSLAHLAATRGDEKTAEDLLRRAHGHGHPLATQMLYTLLVQTGRFPEARRLQAESSG